MKQLLFVYNSNKLIVSQGYQNRFSRRWKEKAVARGEIIPGMESLAAVPYIPAGER